MLFLSSIADMAAKGKMLKITDLHAEIDGKEILKGLSLEVNAGEVHAIMGRTARASRRSAMCSAGGPAMR